MASALLAISFVNSSVQATSGSSADIAIPFMVDGVTVAKVVRLAASAACWVKWGVGAQTATAGAGSMLVQPGDSQLCLVAGATHIAVIQDSAAGKLSVVAVENYV